MCSIIIKCLFHELQAFAVSLQSFSFLFLTFAPLLNISGILQGGVHDLRL